MKVGPDPKLFDDGEGYTELKPSEVERKLLEMQKNAVPDPKGSRKPE